MTATADLTGTLTDGRTYPLQARTPEIVAHCAALVEAIGPTEDERALLDEARRLAAGPACEDARAGGAPRARHWEGALWAARRATARLRRGDDPVVRALWSMDAGL